MLPGIHNWLHNYLLQSLSAVVQEDQDAGDLASHLEAEERSLDPDSHGSDTFASANEAQSTSSPSERSSDFREGFQEPSETAGMHFLSCYIHQKPQLSRIKPVSAFD